MILTYADAALADLDAIWMAVATNNGVEVADRILTELVDACQRVASFPGLGRPTPIERHRRVLSVTHSRWVILYEPDGDELIILRVVDGARDLRRVEFDPVLNP